MKKVVVIAYAFPPVGGGGVQRPVKFVKYLREFGWEPIVLTVANPSVPLLDESLLRDIPEAVRIYKARTLEPSYKSKVKFTGHDDDSLGTLIKVWLKKQIVNLMLPDPQILWWPGLICSLIKVIIKERPDCLFVTAPPFSSFIPVVAIGKLLRVPVVVDFRDEWSFSRQQWENAVKTPLAFCLDRKLEKYVVDNASRIVAVNASYIKGLLNDHSELNSIKTSVITNGYDEEDLLHTIQGVRKDKKVKLVYAGTVWNGNSLEPLTQALKRLIDEQPALAEKLEVRIYGRVVESQLDYLLDQALADIIRLYGYQAHSVVLNEMNNADVLLLAITDLHGAEKIILGKVFEYIATGRHILAIAVNGETSNILIHDYGNVTLVHPQDIQGIYNFLINVLSDINAIKNNINTEVNKYSRKRLTSQLADIFNSL